MTTASLHWVVVGAGSAGCVVSRRLIDADQRVTLVEDGPALRSGDAPASVLGDDAFAALTPDRTYPTLTASRVAGRPREVYLRGRGVGGSSAVNAMVALDGDDELYRSWGWSDAESARRRVLVPAERPTEAELGPVDRALLAASADAEVAPLTRRDGRRVTSAEAYLWPIEGDDRLRIVTDSTVDRVVVGDGADGRTARGVRLADGRLIEADRVVVSAGAIHTPAVLLRSGLDLPGVGEGLQDHPAVAFTLTLRDGAAARSTAHLAVASLLTRDPIQILAMNHIGIPAGPGLLLVALMRPRSNTGTVRLASKDPTVQPLVDFDLLSDPSDLVRLRAGVYDALALLQTAPFTELVEAVHVDDVGTTLDALDSDASIDEWVRSRSADYVHATSSCAIGRALDEDGGVVGVDRLHVCDASAFPSIPDVNTHVPTMMLAERLAARWIEQLRETDGRS